MKLKHTVYILSLAAIGLSACGIQKQTSKKVVAEDSLSERQRMQFDFMFFDANKEKALENYDKAIQLFQECLKLDGSNATVMFELAGLSLIKQDPESAGFYIDQALDADPDNKWFLLKKAEINNQTGDYIGEASVYEALLRQEPQNPEWHYNLANAYIQAKEWKKAIEAYDHIEEYVGINEEISFQKQKLYLQLNDQKSAVKEIQQLIDHNPSEPRYYGMMAELYMISNQADVALEYIDQLLAIAPDNGLALLSKALFLQETGQYEESFVYLKKAFANKEVEQGKKIDVLLSFYDLSVNNKDMLNKAYELCDIMKVTHPDNARFFEIYAKLLYRDQQNVKAYQAMKKACEINPGSWPNWAILMEISAVQNQNLILDQDADKALELFPDQGLAYYFSGYAKYRLGKYSPAIEVLERGQYFTTDAGIKAEMNFFLGLSYLELESFDKAYKAYEKALSINPNYAGVLNSYSYSLALRNIDLDKAKEMSAKSLQIEPNNAAYLDTYAWVLYQRKDYAEALTYIDKAILATEKNPSGEIFEHKGDILYRMGLKQDALEMWKKAAPFGDASKNIQEKINTGSLND